LYLNFLSNVCPVDRVQLQLHEGTQEEKQ